MTKEDGVTDVSDDTLRDVNILLGEKTVYVDRIYVDVKDHFCVY